ncbi:hypothetical protein HYH02_010359 [Chlamydomonas schloesseri]|uniref:Uncharacterized protein n=1 Tax=Chlamydomonas schloesseri TaxID=2026947 RepID=A0A835TML4_9CHLO|nr:hypothetical protein HYH02_010359 [Chlamydomonas schloesseri]|eukprot:KAG2440480.1 hypothetical protein HYH02_010359 [Chlamydomonas schloesseri]
MGAKHSRSRRAGPARAAVATPQVPAISHDESIVISSNELVKAPAPAARLTSDPADRRALATSDQCVLGLSDVCAQLLLGEGLSPRLLRGALEEVLAAMTWFAGRLVLRPDGAFDVSCCNSGARLVIASTSATLGEVAAAILPPQPPASAATAATAAAGAAAAPTTAATASPNNRPPEHAGTAAGAGFARFAGDRGPVVAAAASAGPGGATAGGGGDTDPWTWREFALPRDPMAIVQEQLPLASVYLLHLRGGGCLLTLTTYHGLTDFESVQTFAAHLSTAYNRRLMAAGGTEAAATEAAAAAAEAEGQQRTQPPGGRAAPGDGAAATAQQPGPGQTATLAHAPPMAVAEVASRSSSKADLHQSQPPRTAQQQQAAQLPQGQSQRLPAAQLLLQPPEDRRSARFDPEALEALAAAELPPGVPARERTHAPSAAEQAEAMQRVMHQLAVRGGGKERRLFHVSAARLAQLKAQAAAALAQEQARAEAAAEAAAAGSASRNDMALTTEQQAQQEREREQLRLLRDVGYVSTKDVFVARLLQLLHAVPLRRGSPLTLLQAADMRTRVVADLEVPPQPQLQPLKPLQPQPQLQPLAAETAAAAAAVAAMKSTPQPQPLPLPVAQLGNILGTARVDGLRPSEQSLGWSAGLLRHSLTRYAPAQYRRKLHEELQVVGAHGGRGLMYELILDSRPQYNLTAVEGPVLVSCWEVDYKLWRFGGQLPLAFRSLGDTGPNTAVVVAGPPPRPRHAAAAGGNSADAASDNNSSNNSGAGNQGGAGTTGGDAGGGLNVALTLHKAVWAQLDELWPPSAGGGGLAHVF